MDIMQAMRDRHSVRQYTNTPIPADVIARLQAEIDVCNKKGNLHIQLVTDEPKAFSSMMARYGHFEGVTNYFALVGPKGDALQEKAGYYGEHLVLLAQQLGLNTCWVAATFKKVKSAYVVGPGESLACVIALGYGKNQGVAHKSKPLSALVAPDTEMTDWFERGMEAVLLAPTALNQQKFVFSHDGRKVSFKAGSGAYVHLDLGIVRYHFEIGAGTQHFEWA